MSNQIGSIIKLQTPRLFQVFLALVLHVCILISDVMPAPVSFAVRPSSTPQRAHQTPLQLMFMLFVCPLQTRLL